MRAFSQGLDGRSEIEAPDGRLRNQGDSSAETVLEQAPLDENWTTLGSAAGSVVGKLAERFCRVDHEPKRVTPASPALASNR